MKRYLKHTFKSWRSHGATQLSTFTVLVGAFSIIGISLLIHQNLTQVFNQWGTSLQVSVYLEDPLEAESLKSIRSFLRESKYFEDIQYVSKQEALEKFKDQMSLEITNFDNNLENPLPSSFEMKIIGSLGAHLKTEKMNGFFQELRNKKGVEDISYGQGWVENYASFLKAFSYASGFLIIVLLSGSLFVTGNSIRSSISYRQKEIEIFELVGATSSFIRRPYIIDGLVTGLMSSTLSILICYLLFHQQSQILKEHLIFWEIRFSFFNNYMIAAILFIGMLTGAFGSWLCVSRVNSGWAADNKGLTID